MKSFISIYLMGVKTALASRMAYRGDFFISVLIMLSVEFFSPMVTYLIYRSGAAFPGWGLYETLLVQGIFLLSRGIAFPFFMGMVWNTLIRVREGTFDLLLIKPRPLLFMSIVTAFDSEDLGKLIGGITLFGIAVIHLPIPGLYEWLQFLILLIISLVVQFASALFMSGALIKWVGNSRVYEIFFAVASFGMYPVSIFSKMFQTIITMFIPVAMLGFIPASVLLGKPSGYTPAAIVSSFIFLALGYLFWNTMVKNYTSAGG